MPKLEAGMLVKTWCGNYYNIIDAGKNELTAIEIGYDTWYHISSIDDILEIRKWKNDRYTHTDDTWLLENDDTLELIWIDKNKINKKEN